MSMSKLSLFYALVSLCKIVCNTVEPPQRPPHKSEWGGLKRGVVSREGFATFNTRGRLQRLTSTLGGAYNH